MDKLIPFFAIFATIICPIIMVALIVWFRLNYKNKQNKLKAELISKAIEHGQTIPDNLFETKKPKDKNGPMNTGIIMISIGLGIMLFFATTDNITKALGMGVIPLVIGIGFLLIHFLDKKQPKENDSDK